MKFIRVVYWVTTILMCLVFLYSAQMYFLKTEMVKGFFESFNYPAYIVVPLAILKVTGIVMVLWRRIPWLTEWAYAGFMFDLILASAAHYHAGDNSMLSIYAIPILIISYFSGKYVRPLYE